MCPGLSHLCWWLQKFQQLCTVFERSSSMRRKSQVPHTARLWACVGFCSLQRCQTMCRRAETSASADQLRGRAKLHFGTITSGRCLKLSVRGQQGLLLQWLLTFRLNQFFGEAMSGTEYKQKSVVECCESSLKKASFVQYSLYFMTELLFPCCELITHSN